MFPLCCTEVSLQKTYSSQRGYIIKYWSYLMTHRCVQSEDISICRISLGSAFQNCCKSLENIHFLGNVNSIVNSWLGLRKHCGFGSENVFSLRLVMVSGVNLWQFNNPHPPHPPHFFCSSLPSYCGHRWPLLIQYTQMSCWGVCQSSWCWCFSWEDSLFVITETSSDQQEVVMSRRQV